MNYSILLLINGLSWFLVLAENLFPVGVLRFGLGIPFLLFFPGYSMLIATRMETIQRVTLSIVLSMLLVTLMGFGLNYTPWGITLDSVTYAVAMLITAISIFAAVRQQQLPKEERYPTGTTSDRTPRSVLLSIIMIVAIVGALSASTYFIFAHKSGEAFTSFSVASSAEGEIAFPGALDVGKNFSVFVMIANHEGKEYTYRVQVIINGQLKGNSAEIILANGDTWKQPFTLSFESPGQNEKVEFALFKDGQSYLTPLYLWFNVVL